MLGLAAAGAATMSVITAGGGATATDHAGTRTVIATPGADTPHAAPQAVTVTVAPGALPEVPVRIDAGAPGSRPRVDLRQIVYTIAGNQRPDDPVTVVYADETGALRTVQNVTLPWTMTLIPDLPVNYVTANSRGSQLNCWITDAGGGTVVSQTTFSPSTTCNH